MNGIELYKKEKIQPPPDILRMFLAVSREEYLRDIYILLVELEMHSLVMNSGNPGRPGCGQFRLKTCTKNQDE